MSTQSEIKLITKCTSKEAEAIYMMLLAQFENLGAVKYSHFVQHVQQAYLLMKLGKN